MSWKIICVKKLDNLKNYMRWKIVWAEKLWIEKLND